MNRNQRRGRAPRRNESPNRLNVFKPRGPSEVEVFTASRPRSKEKSVANRCCYVTPDHRDFGQSYETKQADPVDQISTGINPDAEITDQYQTLIAEQYGFDPMMPDTITQLKELKRVLCNKTPKVEIGSQYAHSKGGTPPKYVKTSDGTQWQNVDNTEDIDKLILQDEPSMIYEHLPKHIFISEVPRVKIIAEKFSKYKRNNLELRRLDEKVVCVEYDIFDQASNGDILKPVQRMRAFFSIKPVFDDDGGEKKDASALPRLPSTIKHKFEILDDDLNKLTEKEIEIIDGKIEENKSYLEDLRRILKRKQVINAKKNKTSLDLQSLYEMAKKDKLALGCDFSAANLLSKAELQEVKDLILQRCTSSVHGIRRRRVKKKEKEPTIDVGVLSESIVAELLRDDAKLNNVFQ